MAVVAVKLYSLVVVVSSLALTVCAQPEEEGSRLEERDLKSAYQAYRTTGSKCVDSSWLHNLQNNIVEVPSRFQRVRSCRKSDSFIMNLAGNKSYKYGYNLNNEVDTKVLASYQSKARKKILCNQTHFHAFLLRHVSTVIFCAIFVPGCPVQVLPKASLPRVFCPTRKPNGPWISLANFLLCDGIKNCPNGEDEDRTFCNYYRTVSQPRSIM